MKRLLLIYLLALPISSCGSGGDYLSMAEAKSACLQWSEEGGTYEKHVRDEDFYNSYLRKPSSEVDQVYLEEPIPPPGMYRHLQNIPIRTCRIEKDTNQYLGYEKPVPRNAVLICRNSIYDPYDYFDVKCQISDDDSRYIKAYFRY